MAIVTQNGQSVKVTNVNYNATIPAGGSVNFGFQASYSGSNAKSDGPSLSTVLSSGNPAPDSDPHANSRYGDSDTHAVSQRLTPTPEADPHTDA